MTEVIIRSKPTLLIIKPQEIHGLRKSMQETYESKKPENVKKYNQEYGLKKGHIPHYMKNSKKLVELAQKVSSQCPEHLKLKAQEMAVYIEEKWWNGTVNPEITEILTPPINKQINDFSIGTDFNVNLTQPLKYDKIHLSSDEFRKLKEDKIFLSNHRGVHVSEHLPYDWLPLMDFPINTMHTNGISLSDQEIADGIFNILIGPHVNISGPMIVFDDIPMINNRVQSIINLLLQKYVGDQEAINKCGGKIIFLYQ